VLLLGVLDGLLAAIAVSLLALLRGLSRSRVSWLGRLGQSHDYVDTARHPEATVPQGVLIARPEVPIFFGNADAIFVAIRAQMESIRPLSRVVLSLEESPDLDATSVEALCDFAAYVHGQDAQLLLARVKDPLRDLLGQVRSLELPADAYASWSVDDAVRVADLTRQPARAAASA
jgi:MFS superfamily sulfate permease-like transporter